MNPTLTRVLHRFLRKDTIELIVAPTVADLEFERGEVTRQAGTLRGFLALGRALLGAVAWDGERTLTAVAGAVRESDPRSITAAASALTAYLAAAALFVVDIRAGAQRLNESAVMSDPVLRSIGALAVATLVAIVVCRAVLAILRVGRNNLVARALPGTALFVAMTQAAAAQSPSLPRMIDVDGVAMRVWTAGLETRRPGQPVVVLETGATDPGAFPLDTWRPLLPALTPIAPGFAYERRGNGLSAPDTERPTMRRVAWVLQRLLREADVAPPYVLVGQSWGGNYIRAFYDQYPNDVVGMVFIDADTGQGPDRAQRAAALPPEERAAALAPPTLPEIPPDVPPGLRAEFEEIRAEMLSEGAESRSLRPVSGIPVAVVRATPPGRLRGSMGAVVRLGIQHDVDWVLSMPNGLFVVANHVGHHVHVDDPVLVARLVTHVLDHVGVPPRDQRVMSSR